MVIGAVSALVSICSSEMSIELVFQGIFLVTMTAGYVGYAAQFSRLRTAKAITGQSKFQSARCSASGLFDDPQSAR